MVYIAQQSFGFGEVDPSIRAQYESVVYQKGCQTLTNIMLSETGSAKKRWGSVYHSTVTNGTDSYEFIDGYGNVFLVRGTNTAYQILDGASILYTSPTEANFSITDACSTGNELFLLTTAGLFVHEFSKTSGGYSITRSVLDKINADLITSQPEVSMVVSQNPVNLVNGKRITTSADFWTESECGKEYLYNGFGDNPNPNTSHMARTRSEEIWKIAPPEDHDVNKLPYFSYIGRRDSSTQTTQYDYYSHDVFLSGVTYSNVIGGNNIRFFAATASDLISTSYRVPVRLNLNGETSIWTDSTGTITDGEILLLKRNDNSGNSTITSKNGAITANGTSSSRITLTWVGAGTDSDNYDEADSHFYSQLAMFATSTDIAGQEPPGTGTVTAPATHDWVGPYKNWVNVGKALSTGSSSISGVIESSSWSAVALGASTLLSSISSQFDSDHEKALDMGAVGRFVLYRSGIVYRTTYFYVSDKALSASVQGQAGSLYICPIQGNPLDVSGQSSVLVVQLASSDESGTMADGRAAPRNGVVPDILVRGEDTNSGHTVQRIGMVGCPATSTTITSYTPVFASNGALDSTTSANIQVRHTAVVGDSNPEVDSTVFRVGKVEVDGGLNVVPSGGVSVGPSAYWKLTGSAINPKVPSGSGLTPSALLQMKSVEYHQGRICIGGLDSDFSSNLQRLSKSQNLGMTIITTKSGTTKNFTTGANDNDGLSFQIASKRGGKIEWLKSHMNTLFVGTGEEEYVIEDAPLTPTQVNISSQSEYGSTPGSRPVLFGNNIVFIQSDGKTIRSMGYEERRNRFESDDLLQYARHITTTEKITRIAVVGTATQYLFALTDAGKLWCLSFIPKNQVFGWSQWSNDSFTISDIVGTTDSSGSPALWARTSLNHGIYFTSDSSRGDLCVDVAKNAGSITTNSCVPGTPHTTGTLSVVADGVYVSDSIFISGVLPFPNHPSAPTTVVVGIPYTSTIVPHIPELMIPGKGSTLGREKNVSRLRVLFNKVRGAFAAGSPVVVVPADNPLSPVIESPGFYSVAVVGEYGPQPVVNITQSSPYGFEVSGYNAEYDFGD